MNVIQEASKGNSDRGGEEDLPSTGRSSKGTKKKIKQSPRSDSQASDVSAMVSVWYRFAYFTTGSLLHRNLGWVSSALSLLRLILLHLAARHTSQKFPQTGEIIDFGNISQPRENLLTDHRLTWFKLGEYLPI